MSIGYHVERSGSFKNMSLAERVIAAYEKMQADGFSPCVQIFASVPQSAKSIVQAADIKTITEWPHHDKIVIHAPYTASPWKLSPYGVSIVKNELAVCDKLMAAGVVIHLPSLTGSLGSIGEALTAIGEKYDSTLWLEIKAAKSRDGTFETPEKLGALFAAIDALEKKPNCGLCIDTQHLFACGVSFRDYDATMKWLVETRAAVPEKFPIMFHLNDSVSELGSGIDKHAPLCQGNIWKGYGLASGKQDPSFSGIMAVLIWAEMNDALVVLETPDPVNDDLPIIKGLGVMVSAHP